MARPSLSCRAPEDDTLKNLETKGYRRIEEYGVFQVTALFSICAYLWLLVIMIGTSKDIIAVWEGLVTLLFFPLLTITAWVVDVIDCGGGEDDVEILESDNKANEVISRAPLAT